MRPALLDPAPRSYVSDVTLLRRHAGGQPIPSTANDIEAWLLGEALRETDTLDLMAAFTWRLAGAGLGVDRASLHAGTLHPLAIGTSWDWYRADGLMDEIRITPEAADSPIYKASPLYRVVEHGERFQADTSDGELVAAHPFLADLAARGIRHYVAFSIGEGHGRRHNAATVATADPEGFGSGQLATLTRLFRLFVPHVERHVALRIGETIARTYLGEEVGRRILDGNIRRYMGESGDAVFWVSDLRGFSELSERLAPDAMLAVLNAYLEVMASAVIEAGGEVLKFMGDGLLAAFGGPDFGGREGQARVALGAARKALADLALLNAEPHPELQAIEGWRPLRTGIGLHCGEAFFGNVGAPERLDFTIIGQAVNVASRLESLCKPLGRDLLLTRAVADLLPEQFDDVGEHHVKGVAAPVRVFGPAP